MKTTNNRIEKLKEIKRLVIVVDMVKGFVVDGKLAAPSINRVVDKQIEILDEALKSEDAVIAFIRDCHTEDSVELKRYDTHCLANTEETQVIDKLKPFERFSLEYFKNSTNFIFAPGMQSDLLSFEKLQSVELIGCLSEVCVLNGAIGTRTFFDQHNKDTDVCVYEDSIDTFDTPGHNADEETKKAIALMKSNGIKILKLTKEDE